VCPGQALVCSFNDLVGRRLARRPSENEKLLAQKENLLVPDDRTALFSSLDEALRRLEPTVDSFTFQFTLNTMTHLSDLPGHLAVVRIMDIELIVAIHLLSHSMRT